MRTLSYPPCASSSYGGAPRTSVISAGGGSTPPSRTTAGRFQACTGCGALPGHQARVAHWKSARRIRAVRGWAVRFPPRASGGLAQDACVLVEHRQGQPEQGGRRREAKPWKRCGRLVGGRRFESCRPYSLSLSLSPLGPRLPITQKARLLRCSHPRHNQQPGLKGHVSTDDIAAFASG